MIRVHESAVIPHPVSRVWALVGDFNSMPDWQPDIVASELQNGLPGTAVGCVRLTTQKDGSQILGIQVDRSEEEHRYTYAIIRSPVPLRDYVGWLELRPVTADDTTLIEWSCRFGAAEDAPAGFEPDGAAFLADVFWRSFANIARCLVA